MALFQRSLVALKLLSYLLHLLQYFFHVSIHCPLYSNGIFHCRTTINTLAYVATLVLIVQCQSNTLILYFL